MITYEDIKRFTEPPLTHMPEPGTEAEWWTEQGVDYAALQRFCQEEGVENYTVVLPRVLIENYGLVAADEGGALMAGAPLEALPGIVVSLSAMSMEVGFLLGWLSFQRAMGKAPTVEL